MLLRTGYPSMTKVADKQPMVETLRTMLGAALEHGSQLNEATAATYQDAFDGQPLRWQKAGDGTLSLLTAQQHPAGEDFALRLGK